MIDSYIYIIIALLPLAASMVVVQVNPYHALIIRGILGAVAALVYAVLGAADVALTEALVGTMLAITLYAVAVRSSLVMRMGVLAHELPEFDTETQNTTSFTQDRQQFRLLSADLRTVLAKHYMRLELVPFTNTQSLQQALIEKEIHAMCVQCPEREEPLYDTTVRIQRLYDILQSELSSPAINLTYAQALEVKPHNGSTANLEEAHP
jgi:putative multicomponent Na+:H+ antiporter subunit B